MGSNTLFRKISSIAVAILLLIYVGYQIYRSQYTGFKTETAMYADLSASIDTTGFIIRNEELVYSRYDGVLNYTLDDGEKTAFGGTVAELYPAEEDAAAHNRMLRIDEGAYAASRAGEPHGGRVLEPEEHRQPDQ